jgi:hypothetical protein
MPADPITPGLAAAWTTSASDTIRPNAFVDCVVRVQTNLASFTPVAAVLDGVDIGGPEALKSQRLVLLTAQSTTHQNGIYEAAATGAAVAFSETYSAGGLATKTGLTAGRLYHWAKGNGITCSNGVMTLGSSGFIAASSSGTLSFTGPANTATTDILKEAAIARNALFNEPVELPAGLTARVLGGSSAGSFWVLQADVPTVGVSAVTFALATSGNKTVANDIVNNTGDSAGSKTPSLQEAFTASGASDKTVANNVANNTADAAGSKTTALEAAWTVAGSSSKTPANDISNNTTDAASQVGISLDDSWTANGADSKTATPNNNWDNNGATNIVLQGEVAPVAGNTTPASPTAVPHNTTLVAGTNYLVEVGGRASIVTVTLPDPPSLTQRIEIADVSGHGSAFPITVNAGTKVISDTNSSTYSIDRSYAVLVLSYTGTAWKIL